ncbi:MULTISPECIES: hypothetical protein [unclassified Lentimonas]|uniref:hypothetical protein n=1 Tax=unclassified Lentimonas TaxID=2630993 RepID=UPI00132B60D1|nr:MULTISPECIES: hypothetical protein [unclassified Lentimonas]CAA6691392.1 Unannotated [Lentimonas sp. CC10]CAA6693132.1 Unannotated [Lentimonas sp. CC19]CAA7068986.1 Unannotated [Lentimonas sp. CC11]
MKYTPNVILSFFALIFIGCQSNDSSSNTGAKTEVATPVATKTVEPVKQPEMIAAVVVEKPSPVIETVEVKQIESVVAVKEVVIPQAPEPVAVATQPNSDDLPQNARKRYDRYSEWGNATPDQKVLIYENLTQWLAELEELTARTDLSASEMDVEIKALYRRSHRKVMKGIFTEEQCLRYINR